MEDEDKNMVPQIHRLAIMTLNLIYESVAI